MTTYTANYKNGNMIELDAKTEIQAKKEATKRGSYGQDIDLLESEHGDEFVCLSTKDWGKKWKDA